MLNILAALIPLAINVFRTIPTAVVATTGLAAGASIIAEKPPTSAVDWVVVIAGAIGMIANAIVANDAAKRRAMDKHVVSDVPVEDR